MHEQIRVFLNFPRSRKWYRFKTRKYRNLLFTDSEPSIRPSKVYLTDVAFALKTCLCYPLHHNFLQREDCYVLNAFNIFLLDLILQYNFTGRLKIKLSHRFYRFKITGRFWNNRDSLLRLGFEFYSHSLLGHK